MSRSSSPRKRSRLAKSAKKPAKTGRKPRLSVYQAPEPASEPISLPPALPDASMPAQSIPIDSAELLWLVLSGRWEKMARSGAFPRLLIPADQPIPSPPKLFPTAPLVDQPMSREQLPHNILGFNRPPAPPDASPCMLTLSQLYEREVQPYLQALGRAKATFAEYATQLKKWRAFWTAKHSARGAESSPDSPSEPPAAWVTPRDLVDFRAWLSTPPKLKLSADTTNNSMKILRNVFSISAGQIGLNVTVPRFPKKVVADSTQSKVFLTSEQVSSLYAACEHARWPRCHSSPATAWRAAIVMFWFYGFRTQELLAFESDHDTLTWRNISWDPECPLDGSEAINATGWLWYVPQKQRAKKPQPIYLPIPPVVAAHLRAIEPFNGADGAAPIFPWPKCQRSQSTHWRAIRETAGVKLKASLNGEPRRLQLRHFRKTCGTVHERNQPASSHLVLGHASRDKDSAITHKHYINAEEVLLAAFSSLKYPAAFDAIFERADDKQLRLF